MIYLAALTIHLVTGYNVAIYAACKAGLIGTDEPLEGMLYGLLAALLWPVVALVLVCEWVAGRHEQPEDQEP